MSVSAWKASKRVEMRRLLTGIQSTCARRPRVRKPEPQDLGIDPKDLFSTQRWYYQRDLGTTGAKVGGVSSTSRIHQNDGHTWFPPDWAAEAVMSTLETNNAAIKQELLINDETKAVTGVKRTAWLKRNVDGTMQIAPASVRDPKAEGYLKTSMITPADGARRTTFPEMNQ